MGSINNIKKEFDKISKENLTKDTKMLKMVSYCLKQMQFNHFYTKTHCERVAFYSNLITSKLNLSKTEANNIHIAALLHDLGKIFIDDKLLNKPGLLSSEEFQVMKSHVKLGTFVLPDDFFGNINPIIEAHHERIDGKGYPNGLKGEEINLGAKILIIADSFDAMTTNRLYNKRKNIVEAKDEIRRNINSQFDPLIALVFLNILEENCCLIECAKKLTYKNLKTRYN